METGLSKLKGVEIYINSALLNNSYKNFNIGLLLEPNTFSVVITEKISGLPALLQKEIPLSASNFKELKTFLEEKKLEIKSWQALINDAINTLIPKTIFLEENAADYLAFNYGNQGRATIKTDEILTLNAVNIYNFEREEYKILENFFPNVNIHHVSTARIELLARLNKFNQEINIYASGNNTSISLFVFSKSKLLFTNQFPYRGKEDILYFILYTCEQLAIDLNAANLFLLDTLASNNALEDLAKGYFKSLQLINSPLIENTPINRSIASTNFTTLNMHLCE